MNVKERIAERIPAVKMPELKTSDATVIKLPTAVIIRTKNSRGEVVFTKQRKLRKMVRMPLKSEEGMEVNKREIAKRLEKVVKDKMENANRILNDINRNLKYRNRVITGIHTKVPIIYYVVMVFGLASAIWGAFSAASYPIYYSVVIGGIGVALVAFIGVLEVFYKRGKVKISG